MRYKNMTGALIALAIPRPDGSLFWINLTPGASAEIPAGEEMRAEGIGLVKSGTFEPPKPITVPSPVVVPSSNKKLISALSKIHGLGEKTIHEIAEEYNTEAELVSAIKSKKFRVGGVDKSKLQLILRALG